MARKAPIYILCRAASLWFWHGNSLALVLREFTLNTVVRCSKVMRRHNVCLHTNLHDQTSHFHLYVNAEYVNNPCSSRGGDGCWAPVYRFRSLWSTDLRAVHYIRYLFFFTNAATFEADRCHKTGTNFRFLIHWLKLGQGFWAARLDGSGVKQSKCLLTTMKLRWCVFSHISLFPNAVILHSFRVTLILFWKIPLIFDVACNTKEDENAEWCKKHWCHILYPHTTLPRPKCRTC